MPFNEKYLAGVAFYLKFLVENLFARLYVIDTN